MSSHFIHRASPPLPISTMLFCPEHHNRRAAFMPLAHSLKAIGRRCWSTKERSASSQPTRALTLTCRGRSINRDDLLKYTNGRFLANEKQALDRRFVNFDVDQLCMVAASTGNKHSPVCSIEKLEGGFSKALLLCKEDRSELIAKLPFTIAGPPKYTTSTLR